MPVLPPLHNSHYTPVMQTRFFILLLLSITAISCKRLDKSVPGETPVQIQIAGEMKDVMRRGKLEGQIFLDTISAKNTLQGLGPEAFLTGEILVIDGQSFIGRVLTDSTMAISRTFKVEAPFFVYTNVAKWKKESLPNSIQSLKDLENWLNQKNTSNEVPFVFKLTGSIEQAQIHLQNLPEGTKVTSPQEAHQGQKSYQVHQKEVEILGFFSKTHQGIFTHHDSFIHTHLITRDRTLMGHLDRIVLGDQPIMIYLPGLE